MAPEAHGCAAALKKPLPHGITPRKVVEEFMSSVNMSRQEIDAFLKSEESRRAVLWGEQTEHEGRHLARRAIELLEKVEERKEDPHAYALSLLYEADLQQMHQISEYIRCKVDEMRRDGANQTQDQSNMQRWSLMNCGFDPEKAKHAAKI